MLVHEVMNSGLPLLLQERLTPRAASELQQLELLLDEVSLAETLDERICAFEKEDHKLSIALINMALVKGEQKLPFFTFVWHNFAPPTVRFFAWLLLENRINCKVNLAKKRVVSDATCDICKRHDEDADHISVILLSNSRLESGGELKTSEQWKTYGALSPPMEKKAASSFILLCCWEMWKHRHDVVFQSLLSTWTD